ERSIENYHSYFFNNAYSDHPAPETTSTLPQLVSTRATGSTRSSRWPRLTLSPMAQSRQRRVRRGRRFLCYFWVPHFRTSIQRPFHHSAYKGSEVLGSQNHAPIASGLPCPGDQFSLPLPLPTRNYLGDEYAAALILAVLRGKLGAGCRLSRVHR